MVKRIEALVEEFADHTQAQTREILGGDAKIGNSHAKKAIAVLLQLRALGDTGSDALAVLFTHPSLDVRTAAAAFLLRYRTAEARAVLEEAARGQGLIPFEASEALKRWEEGTWSLDPAEDAAPPPPRSRPRAERSTPGRRSGSKRDKPGG